MKTKLFDKLIALTRKPFCTPHQVAVLLGSSDDAVRKMIKGGLFAAVKGGQWRILSESVAAWLIGELWEQSTEGHQLPGVDYAELEQLAVSFGIAKQEKAEN